MVFYKHLYKSPPDDGFETPVVDGKVNGRLYIDLADFRIVQNNYANILAQNLRILCFHLI